MTTAIPPSGRLFGHYAGGVTRLLAYGADVTIAWFSFAIGAAATVAVLQLLIGSRVELSDAGPIGGSIMLVLWYFLYFFVPWSLSGKTPGMALLGIRVVTRAGEPLGRGAAALRTLSLPLGILTLGLGYAGIVFGREHRALQDVIARTAVVYDWDARAARIRFLARHPLGTHR